MVVARAVVRDVAHLRDPVRLMGRLMLIMGVAPILAPFMGGVLSAWLGWRSIFVFLALFAGMALLLVAHVRDEASAHGSPAVALSHPQELFAIDGFTVGSWVVL